LLLFFDVQGEAVSWASAGSSGFKGAKKVPLAAQTAAAENAARRAIEQGTNASNRSIGERVLDRVVKL
jgi:ribosomal protein S11